MQLTFGDAEALDQRKPTSRERFLAEMNQMVLWKSLLALIAPILSEGRPSEPAALSTAVKLFAKVNAYLGRKGLSLRCGTIVDVALIAAPSSTKNRDGERDPEMRQTRKGNQWHFCIGAHWRRR